MVFPLGVLRYLAERNALEDVRRISTVSGGSLLVGRILQETNYEWPSSRSFMSNAGELDEDGGDDVVGARGPVPGVAVGHLMAYLHACVLRELAGLLDTDRRDIESVHEQALPGQPDAVAPLAAGYCEGALKRSFQTLAASANCPPPITPPSTLY
jgi:hypothetical protein